MKSEAIEVSLQQRIPLSDGVSLNAAIYKPRDIESAPVLLTFTPYAIDFCHTRAMTFARCGYIAVVVEARGRGDSDGEFALYGDAADGAASVEWASQQPWCTGKVGLFGGSYSGLIQWAIATLKPQGLAAIAPLCAPMPGFDADGLYPFFPLDNLRWATFIRGRNLQSRLWEDEALWAATIRRNLDEGLSIDDLSSYFGAEDERLAEMVRRFVDRDTWSDAVPSESQMREITVPSLTITGTGDNAQRGAIRYWQRMRGAKPELRAWLVIGPWTHSGARETECRRKDTSSCANLAQVETELLVDFYAHTLRGSLLRTALQEANNLAYVSGVEEWIKLSDDEVVSALPDGEALSPRNLNRSAPKAGQVFEAGQAGRSSKSALESVEATLFETLGGEKAWNNRFVTPGSKEVLTLTAGTLRPNTRLIGCPSLHLAFTPRSTVTDFYALLYIEWPNGDTRIVSTAQVRLSRDAMESGHAQLQEWRFVCIETLEGGELKLQLSAFDDPGYIAVDAEAPSGRFTEAFQPLAEGCSLFLQETIDSRSNVVHVL